MPNEVRPVNFRILRCSGRLALAAAGRATVVDSAAALTGRGLTAVWAVAVVGRELVTRVDCRLAWLLPLLDLTLCEFPLIELAFRELPFRLPLVPLPLDAVPVRPRERGSGSAARGLI